jgi:hypothetical protein
MSAGKEQETEKWRLRCAQLEKDLQQMVLEIKSMRSNEDGLLREIDGLKQSQRDTGELDMLRRKIGELESSGRALQSQLD